MSILLQNTQKEDRRAELGVSLGIDTSKLDICFGGFAPTVLGDRELSWDKAEESEARLKAAKETRIRESALDAARESEVRTWTDSAGTIYEYVLLDGKDVRIKRCQSDAEVINIPSQIEGHPVLGLAPVSFANLAQACQIVVPDTVIAIGECAFRQCSNLRTLRLPELVDRFSADWVRNCRRLERLTLPGALEVLSPRIFDNGQLKELTIGVSAKDIQPGTFINSGLDCIIVSADNPHLATDGLALYSASFTGLAALAVRTPEYAVDGRCKVLGKKAFSSFASVERVSLPEGLQVIGEFAFAGTSVSRFDAPESLEAILEKAFYGCRKLSHVSLNAGLKLIGASAFEDTAITSLELPASVEELGPRVADGANVRFSGPDATFSITGSGGPLLFHDGGGLYKKTDEGLTFVRLLDPTVAGYEVLPNTISIQPEAFRGMASLESVQLPDGLKEIGPAAFAGCTALKRVNVPESVTHIKGDAFLDTSLEEVILPSGLQQLGPRALITRGAHHGRCAPSLRRITVGSGSESFRMEEGMLLQRKQDGAERVVVYVGPNASVTVPDSVDEICAYAFNGATGIRKLSLSTRIATVGVRGLAVDELVDHIHVDLVEPYQGHAAFDILPPHTDRAEQQMMLSLSVPSFVNPEAMWEHYDNSIINASSFDIMSEEALGVYDRAVRLIARLEDPVYMSPVSQDMARRILREGIEGICLEMARHDDRISLAKLADLQILTADNIDLAVEAAQRTLDAAMTGYLLELKRERFGTPSFDFSL